MSSEVKQLIVVVEGTSALCPSWQTIVSDYLHEIIRSFCVSESNGERNPVSNVELSLVIFNSHGSYGACLVQRSGWTSDVDIFLHWLSSIQFSGSGFDEVATAEGLAEALMMFSPPSGEAETSTDLKRHCILITASNPHTLPTPVYRPQPQTVERNGNGQSESRLSDAETVASCFPRCSVSLSVVCPKQLPKIRALYNAGKLNPQSADLSIDMVKNTFYLVLISENFVEARVALDHSATSLPQTQSPANVDRASVAPSLPVAGQSSAPGALEPIPTSQSKYVKVWEGNLFGKRQGQPVRITTIECYRRDSASVSLAADWPPSMHIVRLISQDHMNKNNEEYVGKTDFLVFRTLTLHGFLDQLRDKKLCAVIQLPSQTLLLSVSDKPYRLLGKLFQGDTVVFKPPFPNPLQLQQLQQQYNQQTLPVNQMQQQQQQQMVGSVMGGQAFAQAQAPGRSQQQGSGGGQPNMPEANGFMG